MGVERLPLRLVAARIEHQQPAVGQSGGEKRVPHAVQQHRGSPSRSNGPERSFPDGNAHVHSFEPAAPASRLPSREIAVACT